ncbi:MAG: acetate--CoA ligase family protein, partial [Nitrospira sp.]
ACRGTGRPAAACQCGLGGVHVELLGDVQLRLAPLTKHDVVRMIRTLKGYPLLTGYRGRPAMDVQALEEMLVRMSRLVEAIPDIRELDLNPIIVLPEGQGCKIMDARVLVQPPSEH